MVISHTYEYCSSLLKKYNSALFHSGIWGSAFCIQFKRLLKDDKNVDTTELMRREREELCEELEKDIQKYDEADSESSEEEDNGEKGTHGEKTTGRYVTYRKIYTISHHTT